MLMPIFREIICASLAAVFAVTWLYPLDVIKTHIQIQNTNINNNNSNNKTNDVVSYRTVIKSILDASSHQDNSNNHDNDDDCHHRRRRRRGCRRILSSFYRGISAAWIAEAVYYGLQLGLYAPIKEQLVGSATTTNFSTKLFAGALAGSFGAITGNPFVIVRTRAMMVTTTIPKPSTAKRRTPQTACTDATARTTIRSLIREDGVVQGLYQGFSAMWVRAIVLSSTKMAVYDTCKNFVQQHQQKIVVLLSPFIGRRIDDDNTSSIVLHPLQLQFLSAFVTGFFLTCTVMPFDVIRTRMMVPRSNNNVKSNTSSSLSFLECSKGIYQQNGMRGYYRGSIAFWLRIAPKTCLQFMAFEYLKQKI